MAPNYRGAISYALGRLHNELPAHLSYHSVWHTESDVVPACLQLGAWFHLPANELALLEVAAAFHDIGFITSHIDHEQLGIMVVQQILPSYGFQAEQIEQIAGLIQATRLPQSPTNLLEQILADADLDVLGREDFLSRNRALYQEMATLGRSMPLEQWVSSQVAFLSQHTYFTQAAQTLRNPGKQHNLVRLQNEFLNSPSL